MPVMPIFLTDVFNTHNVYVFIRVIGYLFNCFLQIWTTNKNRIPPSRREPFKSRQLAGESWQTDASLSNWTRDKRTESGCMRLSLFLYCSPPPELPPAPRLTPPSLLYPRGASLQSPTTVTCIITESLAYCERAESDAMRWCDVRSPAVSRVGSEGEGKGAIRVTSRWGCCQRLSVWVHHAKGIISIYGTPIPIRSNVYVKNHPRTREMSKTMMAESRFDSQMAECGG